MKKKMNLTSIFDLGDPIVPIMELPNTLEFISNSQEVREIKEDLVGLGLSVEDLDWYDSFFIEYDEEGRITSAYGLVGVIPYNWKNALLLYSREE